MFILMTDGVESPQNIFYEAHLLPQRNVTDTRWSHSIDISMCLVEPRDRLYLTSYTGINVL